MSPLAPIAPKIAKTIRLLASPSDGETLAAARGMGRQLEAQGLSFNDVADAIEAIAAAPIAHAHAREGLSPRWQTMPPTERRAWASRLLAAATRCALPRWDAQFVLDMASRWRRGDMAATDRQAEQLTRIISVISRKHGGQV